MRRSRVMLVAVCSAVVLGLPACGSSGTGKPTTAPEPTEVSSPPAPTETVDPEEAAKQQDVDEVTAMIREFFEISNEVAQAGYADWGPLSGMLAGDARTEMIAAFEDYAAAGIRDTGDTVVVETELVEHAPGSGGRAGTTVVLAVCLDLSQSDMVDANGESIINPDAPERVVVGYTTMRQDDDRWTVTKTEPLPDRAC